MGMWLIYKKNIITITCRRILPVYTLMGNIVPQVLMAIAMAAQVSAE